MVDSEDAAAAPMVFSWVFILIKQGLQLYCPIQLGLNFLYSDGPAELLMELQMLGVVGVFW